MSALPIKSICSSCNIYLPFLWYNRPDITALVDWVENTKLLTYSYDIYVCPSYNMSSLPITYATLPITSICPSYIMVYLCNICKQPSSHPHMLLSLPYWFFSLFWSFCSDIRLLTYWLFSHCSQRLGPSRKTGNQSARKGRTKSRGRRSRNRSRQPCLASGAMRRWMRIWMTWRKTCGWSRSSRKGRYAPQPC